MKHPTLLNFGTAMFPGSGDYDYAAFGIEDQIGGSGHFIDRPSRFQYIWDYRIKFLSQLAFRFL